MGPTEDTTGRSQQQTDSDAKSSVGRRAVLRGAGALAPGSTLPLSASSAAAVETRGTALRPVWNQQYGGDGNQEVNALVRTNDGGYAFGGSTLIGDEDRYTQEGLLAKVDSNGDLEWQRSLNETSSILSLVETDDGGFIVGVPGGPAGPDDTDATPVLKLDSTGAVESGVRSTYAPGYDPLDSYLTPEILVQAHDSGYVLAGALGHNEGSVAWTAKIDEGEVVWAQWIESEPHPDFFWPRSRFNALTPTRDGGYAAAGYTAVGTVTDNDFLPDRRPWVVKLSDNGEPEWIRAYLDDFGVIEAIVPREEGGYVLGGTTTTEPIMGGSGDMFLLWTDESGDVVRYRTYDNGGSETLSALIRVNDGYVFTGQAGQATYSSWVVNVDESGDLLWDQVYDYNCEVEITALVGADDSYAFAGRIRPFYFSPDTPGDGDAWVVKFDTDKSN